MGYYRPSMSDKFSDGPRASFAGWFPVLLLAAAVPVAQAADWNSTDVQLLHGASYELGDSHRGIMTLEHADGWAYGDNFFFFDVTDPDSAGTGIYGEFSPRLSLGKLSGRDLGFGPVKDVLLAGQINNGTNFRAYLYGAGLDLKLPGFAFFQLNVYARDDIGLPGKTWQITPVWLFPFALGGAKLSIGGFMDYAGAEGGRRPNLLFVPQLLLDLGALWDVPGRLQAGVEYSWWKNKFGLPGVTEKVAQPMVKWTF